LQANPELDAFLPASVQLLLRGSAVPVNLPFARELWSVDLAELVAAVPEPILVAIGKKDIQTDWRTGGGALETATATWQRDRRIPEKRGPRA